MGGRVTNIIMVRSPSLSSSASFPIPLLSSPAPDPTPLYLKHGDLAKPLTEPGPPSSQTGSLSPPDRPSEGVVPKGT